MVHALFPEGIYYIGDPSYVIDDWKGFLKNMEDGKSEYLFVFQGRVVAAGFSNSGSGVFDGIPTDSDIIALLPINLIKPEREDFGLTIGMPDRFEVTIQNGLFNFGDITIDTEEKDEFIERDDEDDIPDDNWWDEPIRLENEQ